MAGHHPLCYPAALKDNNIQSRDNAAEMHTLIVADDLSGAADCATAFASRGSAMVLFADAHEEQQIDVLAIDADTRTGGAAEASAKTTRLFAAHARPGITLFKKLDSTLRGHVAVEIAAALEALRGFDPIAIVAPSFPATGRVLRGGRLYVQGVKLEETQLWRQEHISTPSDPAAMLRAAGLRAAAATPETMAALTAHDALICDAGTDTDLAAIVAAGRALGRNVLWAGAGGLARALANALAPAAPPAVTLPRVEGALLYVVGSQSEASRVQALRLAADPGTALVRITPAMLQRAPPPSDGRDMVLMLDAPPQSDPHALARAFAAWAAPQAAAAEALFLTAARPPMPC